MEGNYGGHVSVGILLVSGLVFKRMESFQPADPNFESRVRAAFHKQPMMQTIGAETVRVVPGEVEIAMPFNRSLTQQDGFIHAGVITSILDSACGFAAYSLMYAA
jgi:acyl-coenzyme A thioesterase PaaI-like protein